MSITRASTDDTGQQSNGYSGTLGSGSQISANGRYVVFESAATNLVSGDGNGQQDIFVKDLSTNTVTRVSVAADGTEADGGSSGATISADGRYVAFLSSATNLAPGGTGNDTDAYVKDLNTGEITRVNTALGGASAGNDSAFNATISGDGRHVVFSSSANDLVAGDGNGQQDVFVRDLNTNTTTRVSTAVDGTEANGASGGVGIGDSAAISADGRFVAFSSSATNLVNDDTNNQPDIFVKDLGVAGTVTRVSVAADGTQANDGSLGAAISADGSRVAFTSLATNLVANDANGSADVFVNSRSGDAISLVSTNAARVQGNSDSFGASISADGTRIAFSSNASNLVADDANGQPDVFVTDPTQGETIRVSNADGTTAAGDGASYSASISGDGSRVAFSSTSTNLVSDDTNGQPDVFAADAVCYAAGTAIRIVRDGAPQDVAVEDLTVGDLAVTSSGEHRPIRWLGHRRLACEGRADRLPVRIAAQAFGANRPARDLLVSPAHAIAVDVLGEVLIPAIRLINGTTITQVAVEHVTYWHVELEHHDLLLAENLPAESYLDCGNRRFFGQADVVDLTAPPDVRAEGPPAFCRPLHETGPLVDLVRARLQDRAEAMGWRLVAETFAGLHVVADGTVIHPDVAGLSARFVLPAEARDVRLLSHTGVPAHAEPGSLDDRRLGVSLTGLVIDDGLTGTRTVPLDDAALAVGFHAIEGDAAGASWRWTDGAAVLPARLWQGCAGVFFLRVTLARPALPRWVGPRDRAGVVDLTEIRRRA